MASGKKNYFRHSMNARNDHKLRSFMELFGRNWREGYFYFFTLLELCGNEAQEGRSEHKLHVKTLRDLWGTNTQGVLDICKKYSKSALVMCTVCTEDAQDMRTTCAQDVHDVHMFCSSYVTFSLPNLLNYTGRYESNAPNKEKKINKTNKLKSAYANIGLKKILPKVESQEIPKTAELFSVEAPSLDEEIHIDQKASNAITLLNALTGRNFRPVPGNLKFINARIKEGYSLEDFKAVISFKQTKWGHDPKMSAYLRPETIFGTKFDSYLQEAQNALKPKIDPLDAFLESQGIVPTFVKGESA